VTEKKTKEIKENIIDVSNEISIDITDNLVILKKGNDTQEIPYNHVYVSVEKKDNQIIIRSNSKKSKFTSVINTLKKIIDNAIYGFDNDFVCKMQIVYSHFPITVKVDKDNLIINNFYGEKKPRVLKIPKSLKVEINGKEILISGKNKQLVGQLAGNIESKTKMKNKDYRVFDDGIYILEKTK
jgi:large subunit ribosomal protein L6